MKCILTSYRINKGCIEKIPDALRCYLSKGGINWWVAAYLIKNVNIRLDKPVLNFSSGLAKAELASLDQEVLEKL